MTIKNNPYERNVHCRQCSEWAARAKTADLRVADLQKRIKKLRSSMEKVAQSFGMAGMIPLHKKIAEEAIEHDTQQSIEDGEIL